MLNNDQKSLKNTKEYIINILILYQMNQKYKSSEQQYCPFEPNYQQMGQTLQELEVFYELSVCRLFNTIQQLMVGQQNQKIHQYLYYIKKILDFRISQLVSNPLASDFKVDQILQQVLNIFLLKFAHLNIYNTQLPYNAAAGQQTVSQLYGDVQIQLNPYVLLKQKNIFMDNKKIQLISELITLALTKKQFRSFSAQMLVVGSIQAINQIKKEDNILQSQIQIFIGQSQKQESKQMFKNLLDTLDSL